MRNSIKIISSAAAKARFGAVLDMVRSGPVFIQRRGLTAAVMISSEEFLRLSHPPRGVNPKVKMLFDENIERWSPVYSDLAK